MKKSFQELVSSHETPVLVDFYATWCGPCHAVAPVLEGLAQEYQGNLKIIKIDVDKNPAIAQKFQVRGVPTFILFDKGEVLWRGSGAMPSRDFRTHLDKFVSKSAKVSS